MLTLLLAHVPRTGSMLVIQNLALTSLEEEIFLITVPGTRPLFTPVKGETNVIVYTAYYILLDLRIFLN